MNGIHDLGGMDNIGPVVREEDEPVFHEDWERIIVAHMYAMMAAGYFLVDEVRSALEWMPPAKYLTASYYEKWLYGLEVLLLQKDVLTSEELESGQASRSDGGFRLPALPLEHARFAMANGVATQLDIDLPAKFRSGDKVIVKNFNPVHHTRAPRYVRGKHGIVEQDHGIFPFPDAVAHCEPDRPQHVYSVRFSARELWGDDAPGEDSLNIDLFDDYLDPAT